MQVTIDLSLIKNLSSWIDLIHQEREFSLQPDRIDQLTQLETYLNTQLEAEIDRQHTKVCISLF